MILRDGPGPVGDPSGRPLTLQSATDCRVFEHYQYGSDGQIERHWFEYLDTSLRIEVSVSDTGEGLNPWPEKDLRWYALLAICSTFYVPS